MINSIYVYDGNFKHGDEGFDMIRMAAAMHCRENNIVFDPEKSDITRDEKGKPYFTDMVLEFSLSHTGKLWMCMFSDRPCGIDIQEVRDCDYRKIAMRYYFEDEQRAVEEGGIENFFNIWVRKEAYCKMTGEGMFSDMPSVLAASGVYKGKNYCFKELEIADDIKCAICSEYETEVEMRVLG